MTLTPSQQILQNQYNELCRALGDAVYKKQQLDSQISQIEAQLLHLNSVSYPISALIESKIKSEFNPPPVPKAKNVN